MKNVQIPQELLDNLFRYFLVTQDAEDQLYTRDAIVAALEAKMDAILKHDLYTLYKTGATQEVREQARQAYLDRIGMRAGYRWPDGWTPPEPPPGIK